MGGSILEPYPWVQLASALQADQDDVFVLTQEAEAPSLIVEVVRADGTTEAATHSYDPAAVTVTLTDTVLNEGDEVVIRYLPL